MRKSLFALSAGFFLTAAGTQAMANTGTILFEGKITAETCPIEVSPPDGSVGGVIPMGELAAATFTATGQEYNRRAFNLMVRDGAACGFSTNTATVTFTGTADPSGDYFAVTPTADGAKNVAIVLRDRTGAALKPGTASAEYDLNDTGQTLLSFAATYRSLGMPVQAGAASANIGFTVDIL